MVSLGHLGHAVTFHSDLGLCKASDRHIMGGKWEGNNPLRVPQGPSGTQGRITMAHPKQGLSSTLGGGVNPRDHAIPSPSGLPGSGAGAFESEGGSKLLSSPALGMVLPKQGPWHP